MSVICDCTHLKVIEDRNSELDRGAGAGRPRPSSHQRARLILEEG